MDNYFINDVTGHKCLDLTGRIYGRLTVISFDIERFRKEYRKGVSTRKYWLCDCECGRRSVSICESSLKNSITKSCGCLKSELAPKRRLSNIVGNRYGDLIVVERCGNKWKCLCDCGNTTYVTTGKLKNGHTKSCGCLRIRKASEIRFVDRTGNKVGRLTLKKAIKKENGYYWICDCECGNKDIEVPASSFSAKTPTKSCGCILKETTKYLNYQDLTGSRFCKLLVIGRDTEKEERCGGIHWRCKCDCGSMKSVITNDLKSGKVKSCGCMKSLGEYYAKSYFSRHNIEYEYEKKFEDLLGVKGGKLSYDFYVPSINTLIEFQGEQHEKPFRYKGIDNYEKFEIQQEHDRRKRAFALKNGFNFVEIWYKDYDNTEKILDSILNN